MTASPSHDFIIVGAGAAGCTLAWQLARSRAAPRVLLLEAGGRNDDPALRAHAAALFTKDQTPLNWGYKSEPAAAAHGRRIELDRGRGLGGSTAINFTSWTRGPRDEYDAIAELVGDDAWRWPEVARRYRALERFTVTPGAGRERYFNPAAGGYGTEGPLKISNIDTDWTAAMAETAEVWAARGYNINPDVSDGDPIGLVITPLTGFEGERSTAADLLADAPPNLEVVTDAHVARVLFEGTTAVGVALVDGREFRAASEVVLSAGTIDSAKLLLLSGIGPAAHLGDVGIPVVHANEAVGQNMGDHHHILMFFGTRPDSVSRADLPLLASYTMGYLKSPAVEASAELAALPADVRARLARPTVPHYEMVHVGSMDLPPLGLKRVASLRLFLMNSQAGGSVTLRSTDPVEPPVLRVRFLEHPYDRRVAIEATREMLRVAADPASSVDQRDGALRIAPKSDAEEDIIDFWAGQTQSTWHMVGTARMGKTQEGDQAVVDSRFRVFGVDKLRVVDLSVFPFVPG